MSAIVAVVVVLLFFIIVIAMVVLVMFLCVRNSKRKYQNIEYTMQSTVKLTDRALVYVVVVWVLYHFQVQLRPHECPEKIFAIYHEEMLGP